MRRPVLASLAELGKGKVKRVIGHQRFAGDTGVLCVEKPPPQHAMTVLPQRLAARRRAAKRGVDRQGRMGEAEDSGMPSGEGFRLWLPRPFWGMR